MIGILFYSGRYMKGLSLVTKMVYNSIRDCFRGGASSHKLLFGVPPGKKYMYWHHRRPWIRKRSTWLEYKSLKELVKKKKLAYQLTLCLSCVILMSLFFKMVVTLPEWTWLTSRIKRRISTASYFRFFLNVIQRDQYNHFKNLSSPLVSSYSLGYSL